MRSLSRMVGNPEAVPLYKSQVVLFANALTDTGNRGRIVKVLTHNEYLALKGDKGTAYPFGNFGRIRIVSP